MLHLPHCFPRNGWNALDGLLCNAACISQAHLLFVFSCGTSDSTKRLCAIFTDPGFMKKYIPNLLERGGFSIDVEDEGDVWKNHQSSASAGWWFGYIEIHMFHRMYTIQENEQAEGCKFAPSESVHILDLCLFVSSLSLMLLLGMACFPDVAVGVFLPWACSQLRCCQFWCLERIGNRQTSRLAG